MVKASTYTDLPNKDWKTHWFQEIKDISVELLADP